MSEEAEVRGMFAELRSENAPHKQRLLVRIAELIMSPSYRDGRLSLLVKGGILDDAVSGEITGLIPISSLRDVHHQYSEIDWQLLITEGEGLVPVRLAYVARVMIEAFERRSWEPLPIGERELRVLHLNTFRQVPLFSEFTRTGLEAQTLTSYGLPAIYVSRLDPKPGGGFGLSQCSEDIVKDRAAHNIDYDRGLIYELNPTNAFLIDRKANIAYQNFFIKAATENGGERFLPTDEDTAAHASFLNDALERLRTTSATELSGWLFQALRSLPFSSLGFCLFEAVHEYAMAHLGEVFTANSFLTAIDPAQQFHWSMRAFTLRSPTSLKAALKQFRGYGVSAEGLFGYLSHHLAYKLAAVLGDQGAQSEAAALNSLFQSRMHTLEARDPDFDFGSAPCDAAVQLDVARDYAGIDPHRRRIWFSALPVGDQAAAALHADLDPTIGRARTNRLIEDANYKHCFLAFREAMGANTMRVLLDGGIGCLGVPFQPDPRGELLLVPVADHQTAERAVLRVDGDDVAIGFREPRATVMAPILLRDYGSLDPTLRRSTYGLYSSPPPSNAAAYNEIVGRVSDRAVASLPGQLATVPDVDPCVAVVVPFFKERSSYLKLVQDVIRASAGSGMGLLFIMVSNQPEREFVRNLARVQTAAFHEGRARDVAQAVIGINTSEIAAIEHWMIEKFINIHVGATVATRILASLPGMTHLACLEGDLQDVMPWWEQWIASVPKGWDRGLRTLSLFEHHVRTRPEDAVGAPGLPTFDTSDAILARLVAAPLTQVLFGMSVEQLFGGNFVLSRDLIGPFVELLDESDHVESLVEAWLPSAAAIADETRLVSVGPKVHLPEVSRAYSTTSKTVKWVADLFYALEMFLYQSGDVPVKLSKCGPTLKPGAFSTVDLGGASEERRGRLLDKEWMLHVWENVMPPDLCAAHEELIDCLVDEGADSARLRGALQAIDQDRWAETVVGFFLGTTARRGEEPEELFAFQLLLDARIIAMQSLKHSSVKVVVSQPCASRLKADALAHFGDLVARV